MTLPNLITILRFLMVPIIVLAMMSGHMTAAFFIFLLAGLSDGIDGFIARQFDQKSELGAWLDPMADKLLLVSVFIMLGYGGHLPLWLVVLAVSRDLMIVGGVILASLLHNPVEARPIAVSKVNTAAQIGLAIVVLADLAGFGRIGGLADWLVLAVAGLTIASAAAYLITWLRHMARSGEAS